MKVCLVNDTHAGVRNDSLAFNEYFFRFWDGIFFPYLKKHRIKRMLHLGDLVDRRKFISYPILHSWRTNFIKKLEEMEVDSDFLVGNHDTPYKSTNTPNAIEELFSEYGKIKVHTECKDIKLDGLTVAMIPWINTTNYESTLEYVKKTKAEIAFAHLELQGFEMNRGNMMYTGMDRNLFDKFEMIISGHYHHKSSDGQVFYLGTQYELDWSDYNDSKGFHVFDTNTRELTFVKNTNKMFHKIEYDDKEKFTFESMKKMKLDKYTGSYVKIVVVNKSNPFLFDTFIEKLYDVGPLDITIVENFLEPTGDTEEELDQAQDTITILNKHIDGIKDSLSVDPEKLKGIMRNIYTEAINLESI